LSALPVEAVSFRAMSFADLADVCRIERRIYSYPWTQGNFADSIEAGYLCTLMEREGGLLGYAILSVAVGEAHLLNLSVDASWQRRGLGRTLLLQQVDLARARGARIMLLEVRPSNVAARALYARFGFVQVGMRTGYYPDASGREDALVLALEL